jgi:acid phosphatase (class A)
MVAMATIRGQCPAARTEDIEEPGGDSMSTIRAVIAICAAAGCVSALAAESSGAPGAQNPMSATTPARGYLSPQEMLSSAALAPPPPAPGSAAFARDEEGNRQALALHGSSRWDLAARDAVLAFPEVAETFSCALNASISEARTPRLMTLLRRTLVDAGRSTSEAKDKYQRTRPFMLNGKPICTPNREEALRANGSYPSGHAAIGYAIGLVLSELAPEHAQSLIARGRQFGESRIVCNVHWPSDVAEGQLMAAAVVARLHAGAEFRADLEAARAELATLRADADRPARDCKLEREVLTGAASREGG